MLRISSWRSLVEQRGAVFKFAFVSRAGAKGDLVERRGNNSGFIRGRDLYQKALRAAYGVGLLSPLDGGGTGDFGHGDMRGNNLASYILAPTTVVIQAPMRVVLGESSRSLGASQKPVRQLEPHAAYHHPERGNAQ